MRAARGLAVCVLLAPAIAWSQLPEPDARETGAGEMTDLPAPPVEADLIEVDVGPTYPNRVRVDAQSVRMTDFGEFRYTVTVKSPRGASSTTFEALNCGRAEFRVLASLRQDGLWQALPGTAWTSLQGRGASDPRRSLARAVFCDPSVSSAEEAVRMLREPGPRAQW